jgi:hypothetical protein
VPLAEKNHYTFLFPIRPGETQFQITYRLPYTGKLAIEPKLSMTTDTVAVMIPKSMTFAPVAGAPYSPIDDEVNAHTLVARNVMPNQPLGFTLSGTGQLPRDNNAATQGGQSAAGAAQGGDNGQSATADTRPGGGLGNPLDEGGNRDPWAKYKWWILSGLAVLLATAAAVLLRKPAGGTAATAANVPAVDPTQPASAAPLAQTPQTHSAQLLQVLKEEMFALETDHLQQRISDQDYVAQKAALELVLRRALGRSASNEAELIAR